MIGLTPQHARAPPGHDRDVTHARAPIGPRGVITGRHVAETYSELEKNANFHIFPALCAIYFLCNKV